MTPINAEGDAALLVDAETFRRIDDFARATSTTVGEVVRRAFEEFAGTRAVPSGPSVHEILIRAGLIGCLRGDEVTATDLATNPAHMEGFGGA